MSIEPKFFRKIYPTEALPTRSDEAPATEASFPAVDEGVRLINAFRRIRNPRQRKAILKLTQDLAGMDEA
jgi:hypothetical protein